MKILLLEDDHALNRLVAKGLEEDGFQVECHQDGNRAGEAVLRGSYDLYLLDIDVPGLSGYELIRLIRGEGKKEPIILMTTLTQVENVVEGFELGCNDYIRKPFDLQELLVRVRNALKIVSTAAEGVVELGGGYDFCVESGEVRHLGKPIPLTKKERLLCQLLVRNLGKTVSAGVIAGYAWEDPVEPGAIRYQIHQLAKKLNRAMFVNIRGVGYKMVRLEGKPEL